MPDTPDAGTPRVVLRYEESWDELREGLHRDRAAGLALSAVRDGLRGWLDDGSFVEIGALVRRKSSSYGGGDVVDDEPSEIPADGLIAGWGRFGGQLVFVSADDPGLGSDVRGVAAAAKASRVRDHALTQSAPLVQVFAAHRLAADSVIAAEFVRFGYGVDLDFEREADERILKVGIVTGPLADQAAVEALWCHLVVLAGPSAGAGGLTGADALRRGFGDLLAPDLPGALAVAGEALAHLPPNRWDGPPPTAHDGPDVADALGADDGMILDAGWSFELAPRWQADVRARLGSVGGRRVGLLELPARVVLHAAASRKALRLVRFCDAFGLPLVLAHAGVERPPEPERADLDALEEMRAALQAVTPLLEMASGGRSLGRDLGVRATWSVGVEPGEPLDATVEPDGIRGAVCGALVALRPATRRPDQDARVRRMRPRSLFG